jgi:hypothetical protein
MDLLLQIDQVSLGNFEFQTELALRVTKVFLLYYLISLQLHRPWELVQLQKLFGLLLNLLLCTETVFGFHQQNSALIFHI